MTLDDFYCKLRIDIPLRMIIKLCRLPLLEGKGLYSTDTGSIHLETVHLSRIHFGEHL